MLEGSLGHRDWEGTDSISFDLHCRFRARKLAGNLGKIQSPGWASVQHAHVLLHQGLNCAPWPACRALPAGKHCRQSHKPCDGMQAQTCARQPSLQAPWPERPGPPQGSKHAGTSWTADGSATIPLCEASLLCTQHPSQGQTVRWSHSCQANCCRECTPCAQCCGW